MWSIGCIIAEFFNKEIFVQANSGEEYLQSLLRILGAPPENVRSEIRNKNFLNYLTTTEIQRQKLEDLVPTAPPEAIDLLSKLLTYDPSSRLAASDLLKHPFLAEYNPQNDTTIIWKSPELKYFDFEFENYSLSKDVLKQLITDEIILSHSKEARDYNRQLRNVYPNGVLELLYDKIGDGQAGEKKEEQKQMGERGGQMRQEGPASKKKRHQNRQKISVQCFTKFTDDENNENMISSTLKPAH